jgi:hypothetical protein
MRVTDDYITTRGVGGSYVGGAGLNGPTYTSKESSLPTGVKADMIQCLIAVSIPSRSFPQPLV